MKRRSSLTDASRLELDRYHVMLERIALDYARRVQAAIRAHMGAVVASASVQAPNVRLDDVMPLQTAIGRLLVAVGDVRLPPVGAIKNVLAQVSRAGLRHVIGLLGAYPDKQKEVTRLDLWSSLPWLEQEGAAWAQQSADLITGMSQVMTDRAANIVMTGTKAGLRHEALAEYVEAGLNVPEWRARLIARDQVAKWNSRLSHERFAKAGIAQFVWRTAKDRRVVGRPGGLYPTAKSPDKHGNHYEREGLVFELQRQGGALVEVSRGRRIVHSDWDDGLPGEPIQCRCWAEPIL